LAEVFLPTRKITQKRKQLESSQFEIQLLHGGDRRGNPPQGAIVLVVVNPTLRRVGIVIAVFFKRGFLGLLPLVRGFGLEFFDGIPSGGTFTRGRATGIANLTGLLAFLFDLFVDFLLGVAHDDLF